MRLKESVFNRVKKTKSSDLESNVDELVSDKSTRLFNFLRKHHVKLEFKPYKNGKDSEFTIYSCEIHKPLPKSIIKDIKSIDLENLTHLSRIFVYKYQSPSDYEKGIGCFELNPQDTNILIWVDLGYDIEGVEVEQLIYTSLPEYTQDFVYNTVFSNFESVFNKVKKTNVSDTDIEKSVGLDKESFLKSHIKEKGEYEHEDEWVMCKQCIDIPLSTKFIEMIDKNHLGNKDQLKSIDCIFYYTDEQKLIVECTSDYYENRVEHFYFSELPEELQYFIFNSFYNTSESVFNKVSKTNISDIEKSIDDSIDTEQQIKDFVLSHDNNGDTSEGYNQFYNFSKTFKIMNKGEKGEYDRISICLKPFEYNSNGILITREKGSVSLHRWDEEYSTDLIQLSTRNKIKLLEFLKQDSGEINESVFNKVKKTNSSDTENKADISILSLDDLEKQILYIIDKNGEIVKDDKKDRIAGLELKQPIKIESNDSYLAKFNPIDILVRYKILDTDCFLFKRISNDRREGKLTILGKTFYGESNYSSNIISYNDEISEEDKKEFFMQILKGLQEQY